MEAQLQRPAHGGGHQLHEDDPRDHVGLRSVIEGEDEQHNDHHGEKKSVLKKVKDKAKKLKDTIKKHSHGHDHDHEYEEHHEYRHDQISEEEDDDEDYEEMVDARDPVVHGASPMVYETPVIPGTKLPIQTDINLERPTDNTREDYFINPKVKKEVHHYARSDEGGATAPFFDQAAAAAHQPEKPLPQIIRRPEVFDKKEAANVAEPTVKIGPPMGLEEDPHSPKNRDLPHPSNYQSKVADPTHQGGKEADVAPLLQRLDNIHVRDESEVKPASEPISGAENPNLPKSSTSEQTLAEKVASATSVIADKAVSAKNVVASKLGYGGEAKGGVDSSNRKPVSELATEYGYKVAETLAPVYETVAGAGSAVMSKVRGGGGTVVEGSADKGVSVKEYLVEKLKPGDEDKALSEAIADVFHMKKEVMMKTEEDRPPVGLAVEPEEEVVVPVTASSDEEGVVNRLKGSVKLWIGGESAPSVQQPSGGGHGEERGR